MKFILCLVLSALIAAPTYAETATDPIEPSVFFEGDDADLNTFVWIKRPLVVFADSPFDPRYIQQMEYLEERQGELIERDVVVLSDTQPDVDSALRGRLHPRGFMIVLMAKDGTIYLRKPVPWDVREISRVIDKLPTRQQEIRERREAD